MTAPLPSDIVPKNDGRDRGAPIKARWVGTHMTRRYGIPGVTSGYGHLKGIKGWDLFVSDYTKWDETPLDVMKRMGKPDKRPVLIRAWGGQPISSVTVTLRLIDFLPVFAVYVKSDPARWLGKDEE